MDGSREPFLCTQRERETESELRLTGTAMPEAERSPFPRRLASGYSGLAGLSDRAGFYHSRRSWLENRMQHVDAGIYEILAQPRSLGERLSSRASQLRKYADLSDTSSQEEQNSIDEMAGHAARECMVPNRISPREYLAPLQQVSIARNLRIGWHWHTLV